VSMPVIIRFLDSMLIQGKKQARAVSNPMDRPMIVDRFMKQKYIISAYVIPSPELGYFFHKLTAGDLVL